MNASVEQISQNRYKLSIEVPASDVAKYLDRTYRRLAKEVRVPGFRPGKAPRPVIDQRLGRDFVRGEVLRDALPELYAQALEEVDLDVVAPPELEVTSFEEALSFEAIVDTRPTPELKRWEGLEVARPPTEVTDEEISEQIEKLRVRFATLEVVERPLAEGDFALVDLTTYRHDENIDELTAKDLLVEIGAEMIVPELDKELEGKRKGDILKVTATLPERFGERAGWQVGMQVLVKEAKARKLPALDDELAKTVSEFDTLTELEADLRAKLEEMKTSEADNLLRERVIEAFIEHGVDIDIPEGMIHLEVDGLIEAFARMLGAQGVTIEQYMEHQNIDVDALRQRFHEQAERNIALRLGLDALAEREGLEATPQERDKELERLAERFGREVDEIREAVASDEDWGRVDGDIIRAKALDLLVERAEITTEDEPT